MHSASSRRTLDSWLGLGVALTVLGLWAGHVVYWVSRPEGSVAAWQAAIAIPVQTFLFVGLFITAHDAMHGVVFPANRRVNDTIGAVAVALYALFDFRKLREAHHRHHRHVGLPGDDPDFHDGVNTGYLRWYFTFLWTYMRVWQVVALAGVFHAIRLGLGVHWPYLFAFWMVPSLLSTLQLFTVGTWLPHREPHPVSDPPRTRSLDLPPVLSFFACYHFGYHREHHASPSTPWWRLPAVWRAGQVAGS